MQALFKNPFGDLDAATTAPLKIEKALLGPVPNAAHGWLVAIFLYIFMAFYAIGPGVCVWLALSELMPTRIRSNGMSIALVINQLVSTTLAGHLPALRQQARLLVDVLHVRRIHGRLLHHRRILPARNQRQNARRDRGLLRQR